MQCDIKLPLFAEGLTRKPLALQARTEPERWQLLFGPSSLEELAGVT